MLNIKDNKLYRRFDKELLLVEPYGRNGLRIRATQGPDFREDKDFSALLPSKSCAADASAEIDGRSGIVRNGKIECRITPSGKLKFFNQKNEIIMEEYERNRFRDGITEEFNSALEILPRTFTPHTGTSNYQLQVRFEACDDERIYGMGQYQQPYLNMKGCELELAQRNSQVSIPFAVSSKGYGMLWNNPAIGRVVFGKNLTEWTADSTTQMDYWITAGDEPSEIVENYADVTGKVPMMPEFGTGFWQSKLRYRTQKEVMDVAREYRKRGLPISVIVIDFFHWTAQGDWKFDKKYWPDPAKMVKELKDMGIELMVSMWPTVEKNSENYSAMKEMGFLTRSESSYRLVQKNNACYYDATNPGAREFVWQKMKENYYDAGIHYFWLDECEPEFSRYEFGHYRYFQGADIEIGNIYPKENARMAYEGEEKAGQKAVLNLTRSGWAGSQRYGSLIWSGDIDSSFRSMRNQLSAGLNIGMAGIPWWTTDIGGFHGGNIHSEKFRECLIRWFEFGCFCPVFRMHGYREPVHVDAGTEGGWTHTTGAPNEVWSYGEKVYRIFQKFMKLRESMRPYIKEQMKQAHIKGTPVIRPIFYDYPEDSEAWSKEDEYMFGPDVLVAPIMYENQRERKVYLPKGQWISLFGEQEYSEGEIMVQAPLDTIPVFIKKERKKKVMGRLQ